MAKAIQLYKECMDMDFMDYCDLPPFMNEIKTTSEMVHILKNAVDFICE